MTPNRLIKDTVSESLSNKYVPNIPSSLKQNMKLGTSLLTYFVRLGMQN